MRAKRDCQRTVAEPMHADQVVEAVEGGDWMAGAGGNQVAQHDVETLLGRNRDSGGESHSIRARVGVNDISRFGGIRTRFSGNNPLVAPVLAAETDDNDVPVQSPGYANLSAVLQPHRRPSLDRHEPARHRYAGENMDAI